MPSDDDDIIHITMLGGVAARDLLVLSLRYFVAEACSVQSPTKH